MRILIVHNRYRQRGGEDCVVEAESALLARKGHAVEVWEENNDAIVSAADACRVAAGVVYSIRYAREMKEHLRQFKPDVVHIHNSFPRLSPAVHMVCHGAGVPVVQTLHNFRLLCPAAILYEDGGVCEECSRRVVPWPSVVRGCYRESRMATMAVASMLAVHRALGTWNRCVTHFIALSEFARAKFIAGGIDAGKITVKANFVDPDPGIGTGKGGFALFVGRLVKEKGIETLLEAWKGLSGSFELKVIGDGPLAGRVAQAAAADRRIQWLGSRGKNEVLETMREAACLVFPSVWYEGFGLVIAEALATGLPVVASRLGAMEEMLAGTGAARFFSAGDADDLRQAATWAFSCSDELAAMRLRARTAYERNYTAEANYVRLRSIYEAALGYYPERSPATGMGAEPEAIGWVFGERDAENP